MMTMPMIKLVKRLLSSPRNKIRDKVSELEKAVRRLESMCNQEQRPEYLLKVETIRIDKVIVERFDLNNNFANLGIKDLRGTMNIGAVYGPGVNPPENLKEESRSENGEGDEAGMDKKEETGKPKGAKVTISYGN